MTDDYLHSLTSSINAVISPFYNYLSDLHQQYQPLLDGRVADYHSELAVSNPDCFGICVVTVDGQVYEIGDSQQKFPLASLSRALTYGLALEDWGREYVNQKVGVEPAQEDSNSIFLARESNHPHNPIINAGAIVTADLIKGNSPTERLKRILELLYRYTGRELALNLPVYLSEKARGDRARASAYLMRSFDLLGHRIEDSLDLYFQQGAIVVNSRDLATMAATLANGGINPVTGEKAIDEQYVQDVISVLLTCGMYDASGEWTYRVGIPTQSSTRGGTVAVVPQKLGLGIFSPLLDSKGNSVRGIKICEHISQDKGFHLFNIYEQNQQMLKYIQQVEKVTAAAAALENDTFERDSLNEVTQRSDELGQLARVFLQMVEQVKAREQKLKQQIQELRIEIDQTKKDRQVSEIVESDSFKNLKQKLQKMKKLRQEKEQKS